MLCSDIVPIYCFCKTHGSGTTFPNLRSCEPGIRTLMGVDAGLTLPAGHLSAGTPNSKMEWKRRFTAVVLLNYNRVSAESFLCFLLRKAETIPGRAWRVSRAGGRVLRPALSSWPRSRTTSSSSLFVSHPKCSPPSQTSEGQSPLQDPSLFPPVPLFLSF